MMRCGKNAALAVRMRTGEVRVVKWSLPDLTGTLIRKIPVIKNILSFLLMMGFCFVGIFRFLLILPGSITFMSPLDVLRYHGAEHKTIRCYEAGLELTRENILPQTRFHPRCGTGLVAFILIAEILALLFVPKKIYKTHGDAISTIAFLVGLIFGYESITYAAKSNTKLAHILLKPSQLAQHFTVLEPKPTMIDCAIAALNAVI